MKKEPVNQYDSNAVAVYLEKLKIGYLRKGRLQDMVNDWLKKELPIVAYLCKAEDDNICIDMAFYSPKSAFKTKECNLIKITKKSIDDCNSRADNVFYSSVGDVVTFEYSCDADGIIALVDYSEIGELPKSAAVLYEENQDMFGIITDIDTDDTIKVSVELFY